jgi:histidinol-phosphate aminotransferase
MMKRGVMIRTWRFAGKDWCRISLGTMEEMQEFAKAFKEIS